VPPCAWSYEGCVVHEDGLLVLDLVPNVHLRELPVVSLGAKRKLSAHESTDSKTALTLSPLVYSPL